MFHAAIPSHNPFPCPLLPLLLLFHFSHGKRQKIATDRGECHHRGPGLCLCTLCCFLFVAFPWADPRAPLLLLPHPDSSVFHILLGLS